MADSSWLSTHLRALGLDCHLDVLRIKATSVGRFRTFVLDTDEVVRLGIPFSDAVKLRANLPSLGHIHSSVQEHQVSILLEFSRRLFIWAKHKLMKYAPPDRRSTNLLYPLPVLSHSISSYLSSTLCYCAVAMERISTSKSKKRATEDRLWIEILSLLALCASGSKLTPDQTERYLSEETIDRQKFRDILAIFLASEYVRSLECMEQPLAIHLSLSFKLLKPGEQLPTSLKESALLGQCALCLSGPSSMQHDCQQWRISAVRE